MSSDSSTYSDRHGVLGCGIHSILQSSCFCEPWPRDSFVQSLPPNCKELPVLLFHYNNELWASKDQTSWSSAGRDFSTWGAGVWKSLDDFARNRDMFPKYLPLHPQGRCLVANQDFSAGSVTWQWQIARSNSIRSKSVRNRTDMYWRWTKAEPFTSELKTHCFVDCGFYSVVLVWSHRGLPSLPPKNT